MSGQTQGQAQPHTQWGRAVAIGVAGALAVLVVVLAFMWPAKASTPHNMPVSVAGPAPAVQAFEAQIESVMPGTLDIVIAADRDDAVEQIQQRETYGAIVLAAPPAAPEVLTAPAANAAAVQLLTGLAGQLQAQLTQQVTDMGLDAAAVQVAVTPVVPLSANDPQGSGLAAASFPMTMGGMIGGVLISLLVSGAVRRIAALGGFAVGVGLVLALVLQTWFGYLQGNFAANAAALGLSILATAAFIVGCRSLLGTAGIGVGAVVTMFIGNPLSGAMAPWQFIPEPWGFIGQYMVPGASNTLIRSLSYFPDASTIAQWITLAVWALVGVALTLFAHARATRASAAPAVVIGTGSPAAAAVA